MQWLNSCYLGTIHKGVDEKYACVSTVEKVAEIYLHRYDMRSVQAV